MLEHGWVETIRPTHIHTNTEELKTADEASVIYRVPQEHVGFC